ncbi:MAG: acyl carrier protein [Candidatus Excrementavichristensenella sp.]|jgi:acyl carrier protein
MYLKDIAEIIAERTGCDPERVKPESSFTELGIDSLDTVEMVMSLEDRLDMELELDRPVRTVGELIAFIAEKAS